MDYIFVLAGLVLLFFGGDWLVKGAISLSEKLGLPPFLISLTVVGFGTSMPELLVSVRAALAGAPGVALGNIVGSNIANILLIVGVSAVIAPITATKSNSMRDTSVMLVSTIALVALLLTGTIGITSGLAMFAALIVYLVFAYMQDRETGTGDLDPTLIQFTPLKIFIFITAGLAMLGAGADHLVRGATAIATEMGVSNAVIGLTVVAVGTSLPELATSITAALKRHSDIAIGNIVGSNIFNILGILGITAMISPISVAERFQTIDGWVMLSATLILFGLLFAGRGIGRIVGGLFLTAYAIYIISMA